MIDSKYEMLDDDLEKVNGGTEINNDGNKKAKRIVRGSGSGSQEQMMNIICAKCHRTIQANLSLQVATCPNCGHDNFMMG